MPKKIAALLFAVCIVAFFSPVYAELTLTERPVKVKTITVDNIKDLVAPETFTSDPSNPSRKLWKYDGFSLSGTLPPIEAYRIDREPSTYYGYGFGSNYPQYLAIFYEDQCVKVDDECFHITIRLTRTAIKELSDLKPYLKNAEVHGAYIWANMNYSRDMSSYYWGIPSNEMEIIIEPLP